MSIEETGGNKGTIKDGQNTNLSGSKGSQDEASIESGAGSLQPQSQAEVLKSDEVVASGPSAAIALNTNMSSNVAHSNVVPSNEQRKETKAAEAERKCSNCGHPMDGPFCGQCGQHEKSMIRFFGSVIMHFLDDIFGWDSRAGRTIVPLIFRPGFLTNEYFRGRRVHYVPPLRMYFIVSIIFFLALELFTDDSVTQLSGFQQNSGNDIVTINKQIGQLQNKINAPGYISNAKDAQQLEELTIKRDKSILETRQAINSLKGKMDEINQKRAAPGYQEKPEDEIQLAAFETSITFMQMNLDQIPVSEQVALIDKQLDELKQLESQAEFVASEQHQETKRNLLSQKSDLNDTLEEQKPETEPKIGVELKDTEPQVHFKIGEGLSFLSDEQNKQLEAFGSQMEEKAKHAFKQDAGPLIKQILSVLPQVMFVLLPIFALMLKFFYLFSGRYYMEHLTVALHSHAFIFVNLLLLAFLSTVHDWLIQPYPGVADTLEYVILGFVLWSPIYLYIMQKRVYKQGIIMTTIKYTLVGLCYFLLLVTTIAVAFFWGLYKL